MSKQIRVLAASKRRGATSENGCPIAVKFATEGEQGTQIAWLDDFLTDHCENVEAGENGLRGGLR